MSKRRFSESRGPSQRQLRVAEVIRRAIADILARGEVFDPEIEHMSITVSEVRTSSDLKLATVHVLPLGGHDRDTAIAALNRHKGEIRRLVNRQVKLKFSPDLRFVADLSFDRMDETRRLLDQADVRRDLGQEDADD